ncbi:MAG: class II aldolase/adducin family protein [Acidimicrobiia bacterium]|nr:class II aldolase/adducin family protein [Acidimicrobiia bacterium]
MPGGAVPEDGWKPRAMPPLGLELTERQGLACLHRILAGIGFNENMAGHVSVAADGDGNLLASPWGLWWDEVKASDLVLVSPDGEVLDGRWDVSPAIFLHTGIHRARPDARVIIHNHPYHATLLATMGRLPEITHQAACMFDGALALVDEYAGQVLDADAASSLAEHVGNADGVILVNHGAIVIGASVEEATYRAVTFDRMCRLTADALTAGIPTNEIAPEHRGALKDAFRTHALDAYWNGAVRTLVGEQPDVLD